MSIGRVGRNLQQRFVKGRFYALPGLIDQIRRHTDKVIYFDADHSGHFRHAGSGEYVQLYAPMDIPLELDYPAVVPHESMLFKRKLLVVEIWECC